MTDEEAAFVEAMGQYLGGYGMTPMAGRLWAWLLICDPPDQTPAELAVALKASRSAISGAAASLAAAGMIRRIRRRGDRGEHFSAPPGTFDMLLRSAGLAYGRLVQITSAGLAAVDGRPGGRERLQEVHDAVAFVARELPVLFDRYLAERGSAVSSPAAAGRSQPEETPA
ncbi:MAG: MarR family transcriptional regulator [Candidatus Limnocylindrales bacterium]